jgi:hypothetical protein
LLVQTRPDRRVRRFAVGYFLCLRLVEESVEAVDHGWVLRNLWIEASNDQGRASMAVSLKFAEAFSLTLTAFLSYRRQSSNGGRFSCLIGGGML